MYVKLDLIKSNNRQVNKFNNLLRKEGNITGVSTQLTTFSSSQAGGQVPTFLGTVLLPRKSVQSPRKEVV